MTILGPGAFALIPITAIVCTFIVLMKLLSLGQTKASQKQDAASRRQIEELEAQIAARDRAIDRLEERIRVLERIVTDKSSSLRDEIDRLRA